MANKYDHKEIEARWKKYWEENNIYRTGEDKKKTKFYILDMFPYPSGAGLHVGHPKGFIATDIFARMKKMQGFNVLHPMGWDAFGLPAENYALKNKLHPKISTDKNVTTFKEQLGKLGFSYDWEREINTTDPEFYKWSQWIFLKMLEKGLAFESYEPIIWCPSCKTGLANEDLENGRCERCDSEIEMKPMRQWVLRITDYAERLLNDLDKLPDWEDSIKEMQRNWIGRSEGALVKFQIGVEKEEKPKEQTEKTILLIHGWNCNSKDNWYDWFKQTMEERGYRVLVPDLPDPCEPDLDKWLSALKDLKKELRGEVTIVGHSLGCPTACLFIDREKIKAKKLVLVAPASQRNQSREKLNDLGINNDQLDLIEKFHLAKIGFSRVREQTGSIVQLYSTNDMYISPEAKEDYEELGGEIRIFEDKGHFNARCGITEFPEIIDIVEEEKTGIEIFTTRPDTLFGATYFVLAPEHPFVERFKGNIKNYSAVAEYVALAKKKSAIDRGDQTKEKTGVCLEGIFVQNPVNQEHLPVYIADYVLATYGTGAIMAVPAHDERDFAFAKKYELKIRTVVRSEESETGKVFTGTGTSVNSGFLDGLETAAAKEKMIDWLKENNLGGKSINYKLQDWVFSRQRYWGEPIPVIHCDCCGVVPVPERDLPVLLPEVESYEPSGTGESPLAKIDDWVNTVCPKCGGKAKRETNTMPQWAGSSWYYLRFIDPHNDEALVDLAKDKYWSPVDFYVGGAEHATRHLIYARFWHKFLFDIGAVNFSEPFTRLQHVGLILAEDGRKMSKRWGNVINPDSIVEAFGADAMRVYEMFMGPFSQSVAWSTKGLLGTRKFLERVWKLAEKCQVEDNPALDNILHKTIKKVSLDIEAFKLNTAVSAMMILSNKMEEAGSVGLKQYRLFLTILAPFAPHLCEEIWFELGGGAHGQMKSVYLEAWPKFDEKLIVDEVVSLVVQVNGKLRETLEVAADISEEEAKELALASPKVLKWVEGKEVVKVVFVKGKLLNVVVK